jgi:hypothetical protein
MLSSAYLWLSVLPCALPTIEEPARQPKLGFILGWEAEEVYFLGLVIVVISGEVVCFVYSVLR